MTYYILAKRNESWGEKEDRYWTGDSWSMPDVLQDAFVFKKVSEMINAAINHLRKYPASSQDDWKVLEVDLYTEEPAPPPLPKAKIQILREV